MDTFPSFFHGGFECADIINNRGDRVDLLKLTLHDERVEEDYSHLVRLGIQTVREGIRWSVVEKEPYHYDFTEVTHRIQMARQYGIQQVWDICHFGYPDGLMPTHPQFAERFTALCAAFAQLYCSLTDQPLVVVPVNEISFISWLGGEARGTIPFAINSGFDLKYFLCRAAIGGVKAIREVQPEARIMFVEPLVRVHPKEGEEPCEAITGFNEAQYQAMDIITGRLCPELGGNPGLMDYAGFNFYYNNQWEHGGETIGWCTARRRTPFYELLKEAADRYGKPVVLSETGHFGEHRAQWIEQITTDCLMALKMGVELKGICIYPVLDRPDWDTLNNIDCGIWGYDAGGNRCIQMDYIDTVQRCIAQVEDYLAGGTRTMEREELIVA
jgi:beta-glucosidase/6-phospho-beta-glucosidase/beta-galactosidase